MMDSAVPILSKYMIEASKLEGKNHGLSEALRYI